MAKKGPKKVLLIKKGTKHPTTPGFTLDSGHLKVKEAEKAADKLAFKPRIVDVKIMDIPKQYLVWGKRSPRITPKTPHLRR